MTERWRSEKKAAFELAGFQAVYAVMPEGPVAVRIYGPDNLVKVIGDNMPSWPIKTGLTGAWEDTISKRHSNPWTELKVRSRLWTTCMSDAMTLLSWATTFLRKATEQAGFSELRDGFLDGGPNFNPMKFERDMALIARRLKILSFDDFGLSLFLDRALTVAKLKHIQLTDRRGARIASTMGQFQVLVAKMIAAENRRQFAKQGDEYPKAED